MELDRFRERGAVAASEMDDRMSVLERTIDFSTIAGGIGGSEATCR
jgi:hypothetical protein